MTVTPFLVFCREGAVDEREEGHPYQIRDLCSKGDKLRKGKSRKAWGGPGGEGERTINKQSSNLKAGAIAQLSSMYRALGSNPSKQGARGGEAPFLEPTSVQDLKKGRRG